MSAFGVIGVIWCLAPAAHTMRGLGSASGSSALGTKFETMPCG